MLPGTDLVTPRVNAPYNRPGSEDAILWFGRVTESENYADVRISYTDDEIRVRLGIIDRRLWYDSSPSLDDLTSWDSVSLYLSQRGAAGQVPAKDSYRFDAQLDWWEPDRDDFQAAFRGDGAGWQRVDIAFTTSTGWHGNVPNNDSEDDRGWMLTYSIPFASLGLGSEPPLGTVWGLGFAVHDRDSAAGPPLADQRWPMTLMAERPETWGELAFGRGKPYVPPAAVKGGTLEVRHGVDSAVVVDADVGGSSVCGDEAWPDFFSSWGELNYAGKEFVNVQHVGAISEWPCYSKVYVTFPLSGLPADKVVLSAALTLYQFGNAGEGLDPQPSYIEVLTVADPWDEDSITWNNAPQAIENVSGSWVEPLDGSPPWPGIPRDWDVSGAVAAAYAAGKPLRLALYSPDWPFHSGKYFFSSDIGGGGEGRPTLSVSWGDPVDALTKSADATLSDYGDTVNYRLSFVGTGETLTLTDSLPSGLGVPHALVSEGTTVTPRYLDTTHEIFWRGSVADGQQVEITYSCDVTTRNTASIVNTAVLTGFGGAVRITEAIVLANPHRIHLPLTLRHR
jgi:hypothetical protein